MIGALVARAQAWAGALVAGLAMLGMVFFAGRRAGRKAAEDRALGRALHQERAGHEAAASYRGDGGAAERLRGGGF